MIQRLKQFDFNQKIETRSISHPNYALEDHWKDGKFQILMSENKFDYVIIQQGPSSQNEGKKMLLDYGKKISVFCNEKEAKLPSRKNTINFLNKTALFKVSSIL